MSEGERVKDSENILCSNILCSIGHIMFGLLSY